MLNPQSASVFRPGEHYTQGAGPNQSSRLIRPVGRAFSQPFIWDVSVRIMFVLGVFPCAPFIVYLHHDAKSMKWESFPIRECLLYGMA